jgi:hypothetical protein
MESIDTQFEESVLEIAGLTDFCPKSLPAWLREELMECSYRRITYDTSDETLVRTRLAPATEGRWAWLQEWGSATINGQSVFLFETDYLTDPVCIAADNRWGVTFLEPSDVVHHPK